jgi:hypothetical protein
MTAKLGSRPIEGGRRHHRSSRRHTQGGVSGLCTHGSANAATAFSIHIFVHTQRLTIRFCCPVRWKLRNCVSFVATCWCIRPLGLSYRHHNIPPSLRGRLNPRQFRLCCSQLDETWWTRIDHRLEAMLCADCTIVDRPVRLSYHVISNAAAC